MTERERKILAFIAEFLYAHVTDEKIRVEDYGALYNICKELEKGEER